MSISEDEYDDATVEAVKDGIVLINALGCTYNQQSFSCRHCVYQLYSPAIMHATKLKTSPHVTLLASPTFDGGLTTRLVHSWGFQIRSYVDLSTFLESAPLTAVASSRQTARDTTFFSPLHRVLFKAIALNHSQSNYLIYLTHL